MRNSLSPLHTDLYQLTMAYGYFKLGMHHDRAAFHLSYRSNPFGDNHAVSAGLSSVIDFLKNWAFQPDDLNYLSSLKNDNDAPLFDSTFLDYLAALKLSCDVYAIPEGTVVFSHLPLLRIEGSILECQLLETALLNFINFQTLIASKAARICAAAQGDPVIEFGMRRAQGENGALSASRAAFIGGCVATSNVLAGKTFGIPIKGTHSHSFVSAFPNELTAFESYASVLPDNCVLLVDTYDTIQGVKNAIIVGKKLREQNKKLLGVRLDSGDMTALSKLARKLLDKSGFQDTAILASNSLDEKSIAKMKKNGAKISVWGVGTHLATAYDQPALDGVYKLTAIMNKEGKWENKLKLSEDSFKLSIPGRQQVRRYFVKEKYVADVIYDVDLGISDPASAISLNAASKVISLNKADHFVDLLQPIFMKGKCVYADPSIFEIRERAVAANTHFLGTHGKQTYLVGLEKKLRDARDQLIRNL